MFFFWGCSGSDSNDTHFSQTRDRPQPEDIQQHTQPSENPSEDNKSTSLDDKEDSSLDSLTQEQFLSHLQGIYQGAYETSRFEMWIEKIGQSENGGYIMAVLLFLENNKQEVQQFFTKYRDPNPYHKEICSSFKRSFRSNTNINLFEITGARRIWNLIGVLGEAYLEVEPQEFYYFEKERFFMAFQNQKYGLKYLQVSDSGKIQSIQLYNTRPITFWDIKVQLVKTSQTVAGLLNKYYQSIEAVKQKFQEQKGDYYCSNKQMDEK